MDGIGNFISMMDSASLLFGGLALTVMTIQNEEDEDE